MSKMALKLPMNYVEVESEEMEYVDGGWAFDLMSDKVFGALVNTSIGLAIGGGGVAAISSYVSRVGAREAAKIFTKTIASKLLAIGAGCFVGSVAYAVNFALNYLDIGNAVANYLDSIDVRPRNGWITLGW